MPNAPADLGLQLANIRSFWLGYGVEDRADGDLVLYRRGIGDDELNGVLRFPRGDPAGPLPALQPAAASRLTSPELQPQAHNPAGVRSLPRGPRRPDGRREGAAGQYAGAGTGVTGDYETGAGHQRGQP